MVAPDEHDEFIRAALRQARRGLGRTSPNPAVGAVLVSGGRIIARGYHRAAGKDHAEVDCLRKLTGPIPPEATLYITLEPCSTRGRTAPCVDYLRERAVGHVVVGAIDPNPKHSGRAVELLRKAAVDVVTGVLAQECMRLNESYNKWIATGRPFVIGKCAMTLDGRLTRPPGERRWITGVSARVHARRLRRSVDAILVGAETVRQDNPRLTIRSGRSGRQPWRVILTRSGPVPDTARVLNDRNAERTIILKTESLADALQQLGNREITSVLLEGGGEVLTAALEQRLLDKVQIYFAPLFTGGNVLAFSGPGVASSADALRLREVRYQRIGGDVCVSGYADGGKTPPKTSPRRAGLIQGREVNS